MKISAHLIASSKVHEMCSIFQGAISCLYLFKSVLHSWITHFESRNIIFSTQAFFNNFPIAIAAAHAPEITIFCDEKSEFFNFKALINHAKTTIAVPC
jgi:hypothetical protein